MEFSTPFFLTGSLILFAVVAMLRVLLLEYFVAEVLSQREGGIVAGGKHETVQQLFYREVIAGLQARRGAADVGGHV